MRSHEAAGTSAHHGKENGKPKEIPGKATVF